MTDETARIGDIAQAWRMLHEVREDFAWKGRIFVTGAPNRESVKNTQFIKVVSIHTFPNEGNESSQSLRYLQRVRFVRRHRP